MANIMFFNVHSPLDQFQIINLLSLSAPILGNIQLSITNIGLYLTIGAFLILSLSIFTTNNNKIVSNS